MISSTGPSDDQREPLSQTEGLRSRAETANLDDSQISKVLSYGLENPTESPTDKLLNYLTRTDGATWFESQLKVSVAGRPPFEAWIDQYPTLDDLNAVKEASKAALSRAEDAEGRASACFQYLVSTAVALVDQREQISSLNATKLQSVFGDLSLILRDPWSTVFREAAGALRQS